MNIKLLTSAALVAAAVSSSYAQSPATPNSPAPTVVSAQQATSNAVQQPAPTGPTQVVYTPRLPSAQDLTNAASQQGLTVERIEQSDAQVVAVYRNSNNQITTVAYQVLPPAGTASAPTQTTVVTSAPNVTYVTTPPPRVVYVEEYYRPYPYYYYPPVSLSLGFGYRSYGGYHGGFHGGGFRHR
jgi:hypothetical protein